jgi:hypothetical protein
VEQLEGRAVPANYSAATVPELIAAINAANLTREADTIALVAGTTFTLTGVNNTTIGYNGLPTIAAGEDLTIVGNGGIIERSTATGTPRFRLFNVAAGALLSLQNMTLQGGYAFEVGVSRGGAILNQGTLVLNGVTVQNNIAFGNTRYFTFPNFFGIGEDAAGGGLYIEGDAVVCLDAFTVANVKRNKASTSDPNIYGPYTICS